MTSCLSCSALCKVAQLVPRKGVPIRSMSQSVVKRHVTAPIKAASSTSATDDKMGKIVEPSVFNQTGVRVGSILLAVGGAALAGKAVPATMAIVLHMMCAGTWLGVNIWTTFIAGFVMIKNMPRQTFGKVQSKLFPLLFGLITACSAVVLATLYMGPLADIATPRVQYTAILGVVTAAANLLFIEPAATKVLFERYDLENSSEANVSSEKRAALTKKFGMLHGLSSMTALGNTMAVLSHFVWLAVLVQGSLT